MYLYKKILFKRKVLAQDQSKVITKDSQSFEVLQQVVLKKSKRLQHEREVFMRKHSMLESQGADSLRK